MTSMSEGTYNRVATASMVVALASVAIYEFGGEYGAWALGAAILAGSTSAVSYCVFRLQFLSNRFVQENVPRRAERMRSGSAESEEVEVMDSEVHNVSQGYFVDGPTEELGSGGFYAMLAALDYEEKYEMKRSFVEIYDTYRNLEDSWEPDIEHMVNLLTLEPVLSPKRTQKGKSSEFLAGLGEEKDFAYGGAYVVFRRSETVKIREWMKRYRNKQAHRAPRVWVDYAVEYRGKAGMAGNRSRPSG